MKEPKLVVLKRAITTETANQIIDKKKAGQFNTLLSRAKKEEIAIHSLVLSYECILRLSGTYTADFYRCATHPIKVDYNVSEVVLGDGVFPIRTKSAIAKAFSGKRSKNKVDLKLEEHVYIKNEGTIHLDIHGKEIKFPYKLNSKTMENYPVQTLQNVKKPKITINAAITKLQKNLTHSESPIRDLKDEFTIQEMYEIYVPIYEARLVGPKKKVKILRLDMVRNKIL